MPEVDGKEILDPTPVAIPAGFGRPESLHETIRRLVASEISTRAADRGEESFDEANDFDVGDDDLPLTQYELTEMQEEYVNTRDDRNSGTERAGSGTPAPGSNGVQSGSGKTRDEHPIKPNPDSENGGTLGTNNRPTSPPNSRHD